MTNPKRAVERCERLSALGPPPPQRHNRKLAKWLDAFDAIMALDISEAAEMLRSIYTPESMTALMDRPNPIFAFMRGGRPVYGPHQLGSLEELASRPKTIVFGTERE